MKKLWKIFLFVLPALIAVGCTNEPDNNGGKNGGNESSTTDDSSDFVDEQTWNATISIVWNGTDVAITGQADSVSVTSSNGYVTIQSTAKHIEYAVSGNGTGQLSIYSDYKFKLSLEGLTLACADGPAINNQCKKRCYVVLSGTNTLSDGTTYASSTEDRKAAFFSEGQLCFSGAGSLTVTGNNKHALASDDYIRLCEGTGTLNLTAKVSDGLHTNDGVIINDGTLIVNSEAQEGIQCDSGNIVITGGTVAVTSKYKCIKTEGNIDISGGTITAIATGSSSGGGGWWGSSSSSGGTPEGIEAKGTLTISGGQVYAQAADDAINSGGDMTISGGYVMAYSTGNDGLDANGNCYIKGGVVYAIGASSPEVGIDANTEKGYKLYVQGGTIVAIGGLENNSSLTQSCYSTSASTKTWYALYSGSDLAFVFKTPESLSSSTLVVSTNGTAALKSDVTTNGGSTFLNGYALVDATVSGGSNATLSAYSGGNSGGGPGGGGPGGRR